MSKVLSSYLKTGGWGSLKTSLANCVLYAPFWRPDMVAIGGSITSGTGTMAESPTVLAVGANTITATGAGTFIISTPQAGTCVSGTATITGSPVTLAAGTTTTVTTGVTTGTFTVTTGNIIRSQDSIGHLCTVTGALWTSQGRWFDGAGAADDLINCGSATVLDNLLTNFTVAAWIKPASVGEGSIGQVANKNSIVFRLNANNVISLGVLLGAAWKVASSATNAITLNAWNFVAGIYNNVNVLVCAGSTWVTGSATTGNIDDHSAFSLTIGNNVGTTGTFDGTIGVVWAWNEVKTAAWLEDLRLRTRGRFG